MPRAHQDIGELRVPARSVKFLLQRLQANGWTDARLRVATGLDVESLRASSSDFRPGAARLALLELALSHRVIGPSALPPEPFTISDFGLVGYAMMSSATLGQAIDLAMRYYRTAGPMMALSFATDRGLAVIRAHNVYDLSEPVWRYSLEDIFSSFTPLLSELLGRDATPHSVAFDYPAPGNSFAYRTAFRCPTQFDAPVAEFRLNGTWLNDPLARANATTASLLERSCQELLGELEDKGSLAARVTQWLLSEPGALPSAAGMAQHLGLGERTLRRRLADENTNYQRILDEVRQRMASDYLRSTDLSIQQVAELLGYTEATNFRRAFKKWTGLSPATFRVRARTGG